jgi:hypothetical protein
MLLANCIHASSKQPINLISISFLQWCKDSDITRLKFMGSMGGETTKNNVILKAEL